MNEILDFLNSAGVYYLATSVGNIPHVRPIGFAMEYENRLSFATSNNKDMYKQLVENPFIEITAVNADNTTLRLSGKAIFCTSDDSQCKAIEAMPALGKMYSVGDGQLEIYYLENIKAFYQTISGEIKIQEV